jgi:DNA-binding CsgD family transcriptional regulator
MQELIPLTPREREVVRELLTGKRDKEIEHTLGISRHTLHQHMANIRRKTGSADRLQVALWAVARGFEMPATVAASTPPRLEQWILNGIGCHSTDELWSLRNTISAELRARTNGRKQPTGSRPAPETEGHLRWTN